MLSQRGEHRAFGGLCWTSSWGVQQCDLESVCADTRIAREGGNTECKDMTLND